MPRKAERIDSGSFGSYWKISKTRGIKIFHGSKIDSVKKEAKYLNMAASIGLAPKCHEIVYVEGDDKIRLGIIVSHVQGKRGLPSDKIMEDIDSRLRGIGISHNDLSERNIITHKGKSKIVDFSPYACRMLKKRL